MNGYCKEVIIYGFGNRGRSICEVLLAVGCRIACIYDESQNDLLKNYCGIDIKNPADFETGSCCPVCITMANEKEKEKVKAMLENKFAYNGKFLEYFPLLLESYKQYEKKLVLNEGDSYKELKDKGEKTVVFGSIQGFATGGVESWIRDLAPYLNERYNVKVLTDDGKYQENRQIEETLERVRIDHKRDWGVKNFENVYNYLRRFETAVFIVNGIDVFMIAAFLLANRFPTRFKVISVIHQGEKEYYEINAIFKGVFSLFIGVSNDIRKELLARGVKKEKCLSMTCPVFVPSNLQREYSIDEKMPIKIGYAGRLVVRKKRVDLLCRLWDMLEKSKIDYRFFVAGDGKDKKMLDDYVKHQKLEDKIHILGLVEREKINDFWKDIDICVNVSECEGRCISKLEAMAAGCVPIITDVAGSREDVQDGKNGYVVDIDDVNAINDRIIYLYKNRRKLEAMGKKSFLLVSRVAKKQNHIEWWNRILINMFDL